MTQLLEYGDIKLIEANNAPYRVPAHYVQLVSGAAPLDIESARLNNTSPHKPTQIKTEPNTLSKTHQTATDFENLIESTAQIAAATATANKLIKYEPKTLGKCGLSYRSRPMSNLFLFLPLIRTDTLEQRVSFLIPYSKTQ